jgi:hypothetical protein
LGHVTFVPAENLPFASLSRNLRYMTEHVSLAGVKSHTVPLIRVPGSCPLGSSAHGDGEILLAVLASSWASWFGSGYSSGCFMSVLVIFHIMELAVLLGSLMIL